MSRDDELERLLASRDVPPLRDPEAFVDRVMARVQASPRLVVQPAAPVPWWAQAATDPAAVLASVLLALLLGRPEALSVATRALTGWTAPAAVAAWARSSLLLDRPAVALLYTLAGLFFVGWISVHLYRWTERLVLRA
jgi:hypothetical protein